MVDLAVAAVMYVGAQVAKKGTDHLSEEFWKRVKSLVGWGNEVVTPEVAPTSAEVATAVAAAPSLAGDLASVWQESTALRRMKLVAPCLEGARVLWIDDAPANNSWERRLFQFFGVTCVTAESTASGLSLLRAEPFDLIISDIARGGNASEGTQALPKLRQLLAVPVIFYVGRVTDAAPAGSAGITAEPDELIHLVLDQLERKRIPVE